MVSEDFTFPRLTDHPPQIEILPTLGRTSSVVYPDYHRYEGEIRGPNIARKGFSSFESIAALKIQPVIGSISLASEERMDMLWQDFNDSDEGLQRVSHPRNLWDHNCVGLPHLYQDHQHRSYFSCREPPKSMQICCVNPNYKEQKAGGSRMINQPKRRGIVGIIKLLRKMALLHKATRTLTSTG